MGFIQYLKEEHRKGFDNYKVRVLVDTLKGRREKLSVMVCQCHRIAVARAQSLERQTCGKKQLPQRNLWTD